MGEVVGLKYNFRNNLIQNNKLKLLWDEQIKKENTNKEEYDNKYQIINGKCRYKQDILIRVKQSVNDNESQHIKYNKLRMVRWLDLLTQGYKFIYPDTQANPPSNGFRITPISGGECIKPFTPIKFGLPKCS